MRCPRCQSVNHDAAKFCEQCGSRLARTCPNCGYDVSSRANFCPECGTRLTPASPSPSLSQMGRQRETQAAPIEPMGAERGTPEAERRQLTVLFCDLVDSTLLSGQLDPEELREVVQAYQAAYAEVIQRYDGHIAQYLGDGLLVYFGYPRAHEDDARRAVYTGLGMVEAIGTLNAQLDQNNGIRLAVRIGIHTGLAVVGEIGGRGREERLALGETPNVAARIQGMAAPDTVVVSAATFRLVPGMFSAENLGAHMLKGVATPVQVYRVVGESGILGGLDAAGTRGLTPLVGRELEVRLLLERWAQVQEGRGQVVLLSGEPWNSVRNSSGWLSPPKTQPISWGPTLLWDRPFSTLEIFPLPVSTGSKALPSMTPGSTVPMLPFSGSTSAFFASVTHPIPCGTCAIWLRH
jgi:class 3 adenylate cyclase